MQIDIHSGDRRALLPLFAAADDAMSQVLKYLTQGDVLVAREGDSFIGHVQIVETDEPRQFEIKSIAVTEERRREGIGRCLLDSAILRCVHCGASRLVVATATADIANLRFYQRLGFRMHHIVQDVFVPSNGYLAGAMVDGIALRDQVVLQLDLPLRPAACAEPGTHAASLKAAS